MGVPSFYKWLIQKYPNVVVRALEERGDYIDTSSANPNGIEFDCLYLDMNGIIHPCFHPDDNSSPPMTFEDVFDSIYDYIDRLFSIVRPRKLLYMAIDGVAPRAKMNQQRSRRFRTSKDLEIAEEEEKRLRKEFQREGKEVLPKVDTEVQDSNIITPGTKFMYALSKALQDYIHKKLNNDAGWKDIKVILSDSNVPGEGEHKIMSFIRRQRSLPGYKPNTSHCLYGLDADLIMLALATHEVHFSILREDVLLQEQQISETAINASLFQAESSIMKSRGWSKQAKQCGSSTRKPYEFLHIWILREYLELDMSIMEPPAKFQFDIERIIDDFIFICLFTGNDFLPHMPTLEIHERAIDLLITVYKKEFKNIGGYLVDMQRAEDEKADYIKLKRVERYILLVGAYEDKIFKKRSELQDRRLKRLLTSDAQEEEEEEKQTENSESDWRNSYLHILANRNGFISNPFDALSVEDSASSESEILKNTKELKGKLKEWIRKKSDLFKNGALGIDKVKLGYPGWKQRYYKEKFGAESSQHIETKRKELVQKYMEGLCWVILYYFSGVPSWTWYYPYYYGPFASDLKGLSQVKVKFLKGSPFKPFDQLMGVLPPKSAHALPKAYQALMTNEESSIIDFYPTDFEVDVHGKRFMWQGICKLPFIDEERLLVETRKLEKDLKDDEVVRNANDFDRLFVKSTNDLRTQILSLYEKQNCAKQYEMHKETIDTNKSNSFGGLIMVSSRCSEKERCDFQEALVLTVLYETPNGGPHIPRLLENLIPPTKIITEGDILDTKLWHEYGGSKPSGSRLQFQEGCMKANNDQKYSSNKNSTREVIDIPQEGTGWSNVGRGKKANPITSSKNPSKSWAPKSNPPVVKGKWVNGDKCFESLQISHSNSNNGYYYNANGRGSISIRPSGGNYVDQNRFQLVQTGPSDMRHMLPQNTSSAANSSVQNSSRGGAQFVPNNYRNNSTATNVMGRYGGWQSSRGRGRFVPKNYSSNPTGPGGW